MIAHWLKDISRWYCVHITFEPCLQNCFLLLVCHVAEDSLKFSGRYLRWKWTKTIFLAQKGLTKTSKTFGIEEKVGGKTNRKKFVKNNFLSEGPNERASQLGSPRESRNTSSRWISGLLNARIYLTVCRLKNICQTF